MSWLALESVRRYFLVYTSFGRVGLMTSIAATLISGLWVFHGERKGGILGATSDVMLVALCFSCSCCKEL